MTTDQASLLSIINNYEGLYEGNLRPYARVLMCDSTGNSNPYHNLRHGFHVGRECYDGGRYHRLSPRDLRSLTGVGMLHDGNHSGKLRGRDDEEIADAKLLLRMHLMPEDAEELPNMERLLDATRYPYIIPDSELTLPMKIIRDADMSQNFADVWMQQSWLGLAEEMGMDPIKLLKMQPDFLQNIQFYTGWAKDKFEGKRAARIAEIREFIDIVDGKEPLLMRKVA